MRSIRERRASGRDGRGAAAFAQLDDLAREVQRRQQGDVERVDRARALLQPRHGLVQVAGDALERLFVGSPRIRNSRPRIWTVTLCFSAIRRRRGRTRRRDDRAVRSAPRSACPPPGAAGSRRGAALRAPGCGAPSSRRRREARCFRAGDGPDARPVRRQRAPADPGRTTRFDPKWRRPPVGATDATGRARPPSSRRRARARTALDVGLTRLQTRRAGEILIDGASGLAALPLRPHHQ